METVLVIKCHFHVNSELKRRRVKHRELCWAC